MRRGSPFVLLLLLCAATRLFAQAATLTRFSDSFEALAEKVSPAVVQIIVNGYGTQQESPNNDLLIRQRYSGSGVILDADGYLVTNAHVVAGAHKLQVILPYHDTTGSLKSILKPKGKLIDAKLVGIDIETDLAVLKIQEPGGHRVQRDVLAHLTQQRRNLLKECPVCGTCYDSSEEKCSEDQSDLTLALPVDRLIDGKYRLEKLIGKGGMGAVYQAIDLRLNREVAVKILLGSKFGDAQSLKRFSREARASARLNHPNVISIYDFGGIGEGAYLVMEMVHGYTLRSALEQWGSIRPELAAAWFDQILEGVKAAHLHGIIHRDLKPENILITHDAKNQPLIKILDFGLAKMTAFDNIQSNTLTVPGTVLGTLYYMSPEQITGDEVDARTDIFALGIMAVESLTGRLPFDGNNAREVAIAVLQRPVELKGESAEAIRLNAIIQKCVAKNRDHRFSSIAEMQTDFIEAIRKAQFLHETYSHSQPRPDSTTKDFLPG